MENLDIYFMNIALKEAKKALKKGEVPVGAIIVREGKILAKGHNLRELKGDITKHAELIAIKKASKKIKDWRLNDCTIYITLFPCPMCASAIFQSRIKKVVIGAPSKDLKNKEIVEKIFRNENHENLIQIEENVLENECSQILKEFFKSRRKFSKFK